MSGTSDKLNPLQGPLLKAVKANNAQKAKQIAMQAAGQSEGGCCGCFGGGSGASKKGWVGLEVCVLGAAGLEDSTILRLMLEYGAPVNFLQEVPSTLAAAHLTPLHMAVKAGLHQNVALLLDYNADTNKLDSEHRSALHLAVERADVTAVRMLLASGAKVHLLNKHR